MFSFFKRNKRLVLLLALVWAISVILGGCKTTSKEQTSTTPQQTQQTEAKQPIPKVAKMVLPLDAVTLDPHVWTWGTHYARMGIFEGLTKLSPELKPIPANAESWEHNSDYTVWTFHLRKDLKWSDGTPLTAHDYEYSFKRAVNPATAAELANDTAFTSVPIKNAEEIRKGVAKIDTLGVKALDDYTLEITMAKPWNLLPISLAESWAVPVPKHAIEKYGNKDWSLPGNIVSNGPYKVEDFKEGVYLKLVPNTHYYGKVNLDRIEILKLENQILPYKNNDINIATLSEADIEMVDKDPNLKKEFHLYKTGVVYYMQLLHSENDILQKNEKVRQAIAMSINKELIANDIMKGVVRPGWSVVPEIFAPWGGEIGLKYDPDKAKELMKEAGFPDGKGFPEITIMLAGNPAGRELAIADMIKKVTGINVKIVNYEWAKFWEEVNKLQPKDTIGYWICGMGPSIASYLSYVTGSFNLAEMLLPGEKYGELTKIRQDTSIEPGKKLKMVEEFIYKNTTDVGRQFLDLIEEIKNTSDPVKQEELAKKAAALREEQAAVIAIDWENAAKLIKPYLKGYVGNPMQLGAPPLYFNDLYVEEK
ncbi:peptide ABC transporter substrate-binding protein [Caldanaerobacter subterraneus KAk]|uniref:peptide ABC transporter substrate-binding protein n=1 Tax=Caldanaerobacter subterraneus TaxID=911092 RepID=UPI0032C1CA3B